MLAINKMRYANIIVCFVLIPFSFYNHLRNISDHSNGTKIYLHSTIQPQAQRFYAISLSNIAAIEKSLKGQNDRDHLTDEEKEKLKIWKRWLQDNVHLMNEELIARWNAKVPPGSIVYHLGDFGFMHEEPLIKLIKRLNGTILLLLGNHDKAIRGKVRNCFEWIKNYYECKTDDGIKICMFHYPIASWNGGHRGSWQLHGHCHGSFPDTGVKRIDIGVDTHPNYAPYSYDEIERKMRSRGWDALDHHKETISK